MPDTTPTPATPLVSVVINNYNYGRFLRQAIDSALRQTYANTEILVVDDGSTDDSRDIIASYGDRIRPVLKSNGGQASAFNAGFAASRGELIALLDSDDVFLPRKVERCVRAAAEHPDAQLIYHRVRTIDIDGNITGKPTPSRLFRGAIGERVLHGGGTWHYAPTSGQVFRREFLARILPVPEPIYRTSADAYVACLAGMLVPVYGLPDALTHYRVHGANAWMVGGAKGSQTEEQKLRHYMERFEIENGGLNDALARLGHPGRVSLDDCFVYQLYRYRTGTGSSLRQLLWLTARDPSERAVRAKTLARNLRHLVRPRSAGAGHASIPTGAAR
jgi:glycosyltransferase involved in cell wall biosynthesis